MDAVTGEIWSFMVVHHEISQKMYQMISFSQNGFSSYQLMNDSQMVVKCKRMHMYYFLELEKKILNHDFIGDFFFFFENIYPIVLWCIRMFQMSCFILLLNRGRTVHLNMKKVQFINFLWICKNHHTLLFLHITSVREIFDALLKYQFFITPLYQLAQCILQKRVLYILDYLHT